MKILYVEDEPDIVLIGRYALESAGHHVDHAPDGSTAIELVERAEAPYDVVLLDVMMPGIDGYETLERLKTLPEFSTPVLFLSAKVQRHEIERGMQAGACGYLQKPFDPLELSDQIAALLRDRA